MFNYRTSKVVQNSEQILRSDDDALATCQRFNCQHTVLYLR